jgi:carbamoyl-phosphate synthase small subunit
MKDKAVLYLEDGTLLIGRSFGAKGTRVGEIIFNTGMTGYQEILTDPSYKDQIVVMTYVHIGNYGVNYEDFESRRIFVDGFVAKEFEENPSNWRSKKTLREFLEENGIPAIDGVDTRYLTRKIREKGSMKAVITTESADTQSLKKILEEYPGIEGRDLVKYVTCERAYFWSEPRWRHKSISYPQRKKVKAKIVVMDFGVKFNILRNLADIFGEVEVLPAYTTAEEILSKKPDGVVLSNGPGDPAPLKSIQENIRKIVGKVPILAICLGHQLLGLALSAKTYKLKFGHHGINHPIRNTERKSIEITSQNHNFAIDPNTFPEDIKEGLKLTHISLNDGTFEGFRSEKLKFISVQYHPEAGPGPSDSEYIFDEFSKMIARS